MGHTQLDIECLDRINLNGYVPTLQLGGQVVNFMRKHLDKSIPSPAILEKIGTRFRGGVTAFAEQRYRWDCTLNGVSGPTRRA